MQSILPTLLLLVSTVAGYLLPGPPGRYNVTLTTGTLVDYTRDDPYSSIPMPRALMLSVFQPATCASPEFVPYMPNKTAEYQGPYLQEVFNISIDLSPLFLEARLPVCPDDADNNHTLQDDRPILLFSPGYGIPRLYYSVLASAIASEGFTVITIDHPEDANIITYPDGHAVYLNTTIWEQPTLDELPRAADASFVIDQLSNATSVAALLPRRGPRPFPTDRVGMLGHSLGGAASVIALGQDPRIRAAINWDGTIFGALPPAGLSQPVLLVSEANATDDPSWLAAWPRLHGPKLWVEIAGTTHQTFSDVSTLLQAAGQDTAAYAGLLGTIAQDETVRVLAAYTAAWMTGAFECDEAGQSLLQEGEGPGSAFPEVSTVMKGCF